jgi:hypothetical protein
VENLMVKYSWYATNIIVRMVLHRHKKPWIQDYSCGCFSKNLIQFEFKPCMITPIK